MEIPAFFVLLTRFIIQVRKLFEKEFCEQIIRQHMKGDEEMDKEIEILTQYMELLMNLSRLHKKLYKGRHMAVPAMFSEQICRKLLGLKSIKGKEVDAVDDDGKKYEIKATTKSTGTTTINVKQSAEYLIWIYFDFDTKKIIIRKTCYDNARKIIKTDKNERDTIVLSNVNSWIIMKEVDMDSLATVLRRKKEAAVSSKRKVKNK